MDMDEFLNTESVKFDKSSPKAQIKSGEEGSSGAGKDLPLIDQIDKLRELLQRQKFKEAGDLYLDVKKKFSQITRQHIEEKTFIHDELADINEKLTQTMNLQLEEMNKNRLLIENVLAKADVLLQQRDLAQAEALLKQVQEQVKKIPDMFTEQKLTLDNKILNLSSRLILDKTKKTIADFELKKKEMEILLDQSFSHINVGRLDLAKKIYIQVSKLYESLPDGFLYDKLQLYRKMLKVYHETELSIELKALQVDEKIAKQMMQDSQIPGAKQGFAAQSTAGIQAPLAPKIMGAPLPTRAAMPSSTASAVSSASTASAAPFAAKSSPSISSKAETAKAAGKIAPAPTAKGMKMPPLPSKK